MYEKYGKVAGSDAIKSAVHLLHAKAESEGNIINVSLRIARSDSCTFSYDLTDGKWRSVRIDKTGWKIMYEGAVLFTRYNQTPQVEPTHRYDSNVIDQLFRLINLPDKNDQLLVKVHLISLFVPDIPHPILNVHGDKGSAKTVFLTLVKMIVDPSRPVLLTIPKDRNEFNQQISHNYFSVYDNVKFTPDWLSDEACRAVTGGGNTKRKLYTDDEDFVYEYKHALSFTGINVSLREPDALDRSILIELARIPKSRRRLESEIYSEFEKIRPALLGYIFDILFKAIGIIGEIKLHDLPRMADFTLWGEAIARAMGYKEMEFVDAYFANIGRQNIEAIESHPLGQAIAKLVDSWEPEVSEQEYSTRELLDMLETIALENKISSNHTSWPKGLNALTRRLNQIKSNLLEGLEIEVTVSRSTAGGKKANTAVIRIRKMSPVSPTPPASKNHERNILDFLGDTEPSSTKISPVSNDDSHPQNARIGETGGNGDICESKGVGRTESFQCPYCNHQTQSYEDLEGHSVRLHPGRPFAEDFRNPSTKDS